MSSSGLWRPSGDLADAVTDDSDSDNNNDPAMAVAAMTDNDAYTTMPKRYFL